MKTAITIAPGETIAVEPNIPGAGLALTIVSGRMAFHRYLSCDMAASLSLGLEMALNGQEGVFSVQVTQFERISVTNIGGGIAIELRIPVVSVRRTLMQDTARALLYGLEKAMEAADCAAARAAARAAA